MISCACVKPIFIISVASSPERFKNGGVLKQSQKSSVHHQTLRVLEWDKLCDSVASFASTSLGREATWSQIWSLNQTFKESIRLLDETNAALEIHKHGGCTLDFSTIDVALVKSAIQHARRMLPVEGNEAMAIVALLQLTETLQLNLKAAIKEDADWYKRFMPISELIMELVTNRSLVKLIQQVIDEDGSVKESASSALKQSRDQVRTLEGKLHQLMVSIVRNNANETSSLEVRNVSGRWCVRSEASLTNVKGLLLSSDSGVGSLIEPLSAVPLNDELQQARALVAKAEADVLLKLTEKMQMHLEDIERLLDRVIQLDVINARATYGLSFGGTFPDLFLTEDKNGSPTEAHLSGNGTSEASYPIKREWTLHLPKAYHPLLIQRYRQNLLKARKEVSSAVAELRRKKQQGEKFYDKEESDRNLSSLKMQITRLEQSPPVPVDFFITRRTRVLVITGPNTGGKTICLKTVGLAAMMARSGRHQECQFLSLLHICCLQKFNSGIATTLKYLLSVNANCNGLHVLASEPVRIPWFDSVFADVGDEQSLSQSLSTFSGHLKQISEIKAESTNRSLVLLDEVGAGTNPLEGAALGMSLLESFAESGALLTIATTHHSELKTLKYSNNAFENACMEFDEVNLKPTYRILWGIPGRSNALNIAERLGVPEKILHKARLRYGTASAEINEVIIDMENFKQQFQKHVNEARHYLTLSRGLYKKLSATRRKLMKHGIDLRYRKMREVSEAAGVARSLLHKKVRQLRTSATRPPQPTSEENQHVSANTNQPRTENVNEPLSASKRPESVKVPLQPSSEKRGVPRVGDIVHVSSIGKKATVLKVEASKKQLVVQAGSVKLKLKLTDIQT